MLESSLEDILLSFCTRWTQIAREDKRTRTNQFSGYSGTDGWLFTHTSCLSACSLLSRNSAQVWIFEYDQWEKSLPGKGLWLLSTSDLRRMTDSADKLRRLYMTAYIEWSNERDGIQIGRAPSIIDNNNTIHSTSNNLRTCQGLPQAFRPFPNLNDKHFNAYGVVFCHILRIGTILWQSY